MIEIQWTTEFGSKGLEFQNGEYQNGIWSRVLKHGQPVTLPRLNRGDTLRRYQRILRAL